MWRISSGHMFSQPKLLSQRVRAVRRARGPKHVGKEDGGEDSLQAEKAVADTGEIDVRRHSRHWCLARRIAWPYGQVFPVGVHTRRHFSSGKLTFESVDRVICIRKGLHGKEKSLRSSRTLPRQELSVPVNRRPSHPEPGRTVSVRLSGVPLGRPGLCLAARRSFRRQGRNSCCSWSPEAEQPKTAGIYLLNRTTVKR
ncbi:hypothetical protein M8818_004839 [Zalaria obscura]|uniref:Uncharacterized protein n=1 Tax=Zalaria obscura TaxID=2024903 RepID=A0ACC3SB69_9PEZI